MNKSKEKTLFEGVTDKQLFEMSQIAYEDLIHDTEKLIILPVISALSWQEASLIIANRLHGKDYKNPLRPKTASQFPEWVETDQLPFWKQIYSIRKWAGCSLKWSPEQLQDHLMRCAGVSEFRDLDREKTKVIFVSMIKIIEWGYRI